MSWKMQVTYSLKLSNVTLKSGQNLKRKENVFQPLNQFSQNFSLLVSGEGHDG